MQKNNRHGIPVKNLIGNQIHKNFLQLESSYAIEKRGGSLLPGLTVKHTSRLVHDINLLNRFDLHELIFSDELFITAS